MSNEPKSLRSPTTQAGRALLSRIHALGMSRYGHITLQDGWSDVDAERDILSIEAEAAAAPTAHHTKECFERQYIIELPENPYRSCICASEPAD